MPEDSSTPVAIVTGAGQGIGRAIAARLLGDGYRVVIAELDREAGEEAAEALGARGDARFMPTDVADEGQVQALMRHTLDTAGRIDALVNNAGISANRPMSELSLDEWRRVLDVNLTGAFLCTRHASSALARAGGAVVNIASTRALMSEPDTEAYSASKGGLLALTHALAVSLGPDVRVNGISPGWIEVSDWRKRSAREAVALTEADHAQHPAGRVGRPEDVADLAAYLLSASAGFITGANFVVDGGMTRKMIYVD